MHTQAVFQGSWQSMLLIPYAPASSSLTSKVNNFHMHYKQNPNLNPSMLPEKCSLCWSGNYEYYFTSNLKFWKENLRLFLKANSSLWYFSTPSLLHSAIHVEQQISLKATQTRASEILVFLLHLLPPTVHDWKRSGYSSQTLEKTDYVRCVPSQHFSHGSTDFAVLCIVNHILITDATSVFPFGSCLQESQRVLLIIFHLCQIYWMWLIET